ncbi:hypothetical protein J5N97_015221 [Dioscorea zingiberensis]|uniref:Uncharacterized protein n=1 Tax=Dioscorea zingiberensis TaxID=325984 RepID=A0A9D5CVF5_9LILI|nr:hypothetical protein J5N97_015221 [Dioscorea zingiberensis]
MPFSFLRLLSPTNFPRSLRQLEHDVETVINVLQPGPLGIVEHKFSAVEVQAAKDTVHKAVDTWRKNAVLERDTQARSIKKNLSRESCLNQSASFRIKALVALSDEFIQGTILTMKRKAWQHFEVLVQWCPFQKCEQGTDPQHRYSPFS